MISQDTIVEVRQKADILDVVSCFLRLKKQGSTYSALSPFSSEKTASFFVVPQKNIYKDFSSGKGGDCIDFLIQHERISFYEAILWLCNRYKIEVKRDGGSEGHEAEKRYSDASSAMLTAMNIYRGSWPHHPQAVNFMFGRGFSQKEIVNFKIGYAPSEWQNLGQTVHGGFMDAGLAKPHQNGGYYSFFRDRIVFPIFSISGKLVGFTARLLQDAEGQPKYLHSPTSILFDKSNTLYGLYWSRKSIIKEDKCYVIEGPMDYHAMVRVQVTNTCATLGTGITSGQIKQIKRFTSNLVILYDADKGGLLGMHKALTLCLSEGIIPSFVFLPSKEDPDSIIRKHGETYFRSVLSKEDDCATAILMLSEFNPSAPLGHQQKSLETISSTIAYSLDSQVRTILAMSISQKTGIAHQTILDGVNKSKSLKPHELDGMEDMPAPVDARTMFEEKLIAILKYQFDSECYSQTTSGWEKITAWRYVYMIMKHLDVSFRDDRFVHVLTALESYTEGTDIPSTLPAIVRYGFYSLSEKTLYATITKIILDISLLDAKEKMDAALNEEKENWALECKQIENTIEDIYRLSNTIPD